MDMEKVDHISFTEIRFGKEYVFALEDMVDNKKLMSFVGQRIKQKQQLSTDPEILNYLYMIMADEIASEFNTKAKVWVRENSWRVGD